MTIRERYFSYEGSRVFVGEEVERSDVN